MKELLKFITCGSVDDGKSTLIGHMLYDSKLLFADQERALELESKVGSTDGSLDYSLLLDGLMAEREQGITIDVAYRYFTTSKRSFIVADTPGHEEYTRNMAVGASFADAAVILLDATKGVLVQTRRHTRICSLMGIRDFIFIVNKMDLAEYQESVFRNIKKELEEFVQIFPCNSMAVIPVSATVGDNITTDSEHMDCYQGPTLLSYLEDLELDTNNAEDDFVLPVQRVSRPNHTFRGFQGQVEAGSLRIGDVITVYPSGEQASVSRLLAAGEDTEEIIKGQPVTICLDREIDCSRGCVIVKGQAPVVGNMFRVTMLWMDDVPLVEGKEYMLKLGTRKIPARVVKIEYKIDVNTGEQKPADSLGKNEIAECEITFVDRVVADVFSKLKTLGELILIDRVTNMTSACGVVEAVAEKVTNGTEKASFRLNDLTARGDIFEEFYYDTSSLNVLKYQPVNRTYTVGDEIPVSGESYQYPDSFDIIVLRDQVAVRVRDKKITAILPAANYVYDHVPVINGRGFAVLADSNEQVQQFLQEYAVTNEADQTAFFAKWVRFDTYRKVIFPQ